MRLARLKNELPQFGKHHGGVSTTFLPESTVRENGRPSDHRLRGKAVVVEQCLRYADDLVSIYEEEKARREALKKANEQLKHEVAARLKAEQELLKEQKRLEQRVRQRTKKLAEANRLLEVEVEQRKYVEKDLKASLKEKETLLSEIHHRVKNNLQIISSLLALQGSRVENAKVRQALQDSQSRVRSMALIHEQLYRSKDLAGIDFSEYIRNLTRALLQTHCDMPAPIDIKLHVDHALLPIELAVPCGLVISELVTNCLKHAFPAQHRGEIRIDFGRNKKNGKHVLIVADNGKGLPESYDCRESGSLGLQLVTNLVQLQLHGTMEAKTNGGTTFSIEFQDRQQAYRGRCG
jgi:two-component sensor histidine kinase